MDCAPEDEIPARPVPDAGDDENQRDVEGPPAHPPSPEGNIKIITKPLTQSDVPPPPEFHHAPGTIRTAKIQCQSHSQTSGQAERYQAVAGKIIINPKPENQVVHPDEVGIGSGCAIKKTCQIIRQTQLEKQSQSHPAGALIKIYR